MHLELVYEILLRVVQGIDDHLLLRYIGTDQSADHDGSSKSADLPTAKRQMPSSSAFLPQLVSRLRSLDGRERCIVSEILKVIYARAAGSDSQQPIHKLQKQFHKLLASRCRQYVRDANSVQDEDEHKANKVAVDFFNQHQDVPEILQLIRWIITTHSQDLTDQECRELLCDALIPLHNSPHLDEFHEVLQQCCMELVTRDSYALYPLLSALLRFWPSSEDNVTESTLWASLDPVKEQLFIDETVALLRSSFDFIQKTFEHPAQVHLHASRRRAKGQRFSDDVKFRSSSWRRSRTCAKPRRACTIWWRRAR